MASHPRSKRRQPIALAQVDRTCSPSCLLALVGSATMPFSGLCRAGTGTPQVGAHIGIMRGPPGKPAVCRRGGNWPHIIPAGCTNALAFNCRSAWTYVCVPSTDSWPSQRAVHVSHDLLDGIAAQPRIAVTDEEQIGLGPATLRKPIAQHGGIFADRCGRSLRPLPMHCICAPAPSTISRRTG
jgi:hypothetical protein